MPKNEGFPIHDVVGYGPICAVDEDSGCLVTVNGAYVNLWVPSGDGLYTNTDCRSGHADLFKLTGAQMIDIAESCLTDWLRGEEKEEEEPEPDEPAPMTDHEADLYDKENDR